MLKASRFWSKTISPARFMTTAAPPVPIPKNGVDYRGKLVLAPMVRSGELPSRLMALQYGADLVWGPETVDRAMIGTTRHVNPRTSAIEFTRLSSGLVNAPADAQRESIIYRLHPERESRQLIFQIGTASPELAVEAASLVAGDVAGIDVNAGCPKPFSTSGGMGAALLRTPDLLCDILRALVEHVGKKWEIGISVKIRLLPTEEETRELVTRLCATGITGLTIHCRTREMRKHTRAIRTQLRMVGEVCRAAGVACLMNGDVEDRTQAEALIKEYGVDGAMIATAAEKNPSVFRSAEAGGLADWQKIVHEYMTIALDVENKWGNTKFLLAQLIPGKHQSYRSINQARNYEHTCQILDLNDLIPRAREVDAILGLTDRETKSDQKARKRAQMQESSGNAGASHEKAKKAKSHPGEGPSEAIFPAAFAPQDGAAPQVLAV